MPLTIFLTACTKTIDEKPIFDPFEINYNVTEKGLLESGHEKIPEDVPLLGKKIGDTLTDVTHEDTESWLKNANLNHGQAHRGYSDGLPNQFVWEGHHLN